MKIPLSWISLYTPLNSVLEKYSIKDLAHEYSIHTAEIDGIEEHFLDKVVVGKVLSCEKHPESKKLSIVRVNLGEHGEETILTGAPNISEALYVPVAIVGAILPGDFVIGERMMAGMMSRGMICGADEISMSKEESIGIMVLENDWDREVLETMIGKSFFDLTLPFPGRKGEIYHYPLRDTTFEIDNKFITNRPDLFSVVGNAREFHAVFETPLTDSVIPANAGIQGIDPETSSGGQIPLTLDTRIETPHCLSYHLMKMEDITVGKSPYGISLMMERSGLSPKMDIVDITNLIMTELGQPMHAFDADKITGNICVRMAQKGEKILALNDTEYELSEKDMVIADEKGPVALAGVIGGMESAVSLSTKNIIWESACFDATSVRLTAQRHGIRTDASTRYEKSLDPLLAGTTFSRVGEYMDFLGKDYKITATSSYIDDTRVQNIEIDIKTDFIDRVASIHVPEERIISILIRLGFEVRKNQDSLTVKVPSWRATKDVSIPEDIAEEITRVIGYESLTPTALPVGPGIQKRNDELFLRNLTLDHFQSEKWHEVYSYSFTNETLDISIGLDDMDGAIEVRNAFNQEYTHMRRSLAPRLFLAAKENKKHAETLGFFEIAKIYTKNETLLTSNPLLENIALKPFPEKKILAGILLGGTLEKLRSVLESYLVEVLGYIPPIKSGSSMSIFHPGISGSYHVGEDILIEFGALHPAVGDAYDLGEDVFYFESSFGLLLDHLKNKDVRFHPISRYQTIPRELNFILSEHTPTGEVARTLDSLHPWINDVHVASIYEDPEKIGPGKKSVNFSFILSNHDATISDEESLHVQNLIIEEMHKKGYELRGL